MAIERTEKIQWHAEGTLRAVTRWISSHDEGIAELLKNVRRAYQVDRLDVAEQDRAALVLFQDGTPGVPARIGVLDVGGAALEDVEAWSVWHDPDASRRNSTLDEEETQGNGGKAYLHAMFTGQCQFLGVANRRRNCMGFEGPPNSEERGTPGWIPSRLEAREVEIASLDAELGEALKPYGLGPADLPEPVRSAIESRQAFTLVEGVGPIGLYKDRVDVSEVLNKVLRHDQCTLVIDQLDLFAMHNGQLANDGKKLALPQIVPYPRLERPEIHPIPEELELSSGEKISTTEGGTKPQGRLSLFTSKWNMHMAYKNLRPRWRMSYKTVHQAIGSKSISELAPGTPGSMYVYGVVELPALEPGYVETGRKRPKDGPLVEALDRFIAQHIRELAKKINDFRKQNLDDRALDQVHEENRLLDQFKNSFLPSGDGSGGSGGQGVGRGRTRTHHERVTGKTPEELIYSVPPGGINIAEAVSAHLPYILNLGVRDDKGRAVPTAKLEWFTSDQRLVGLEGNVLTAKTKGKCDVWVRVVGTDLESEHVPVRVWKVDHVFLAPRELEIAVGSKEQVVAEVTDDDGERSVDVLLDWKHDSDDQLIVLIGPRGWVTGNREGRTGVIAGAAGVWASRPVEVLVKQGEDKETGNSGGFPEMMLTDRDVDPATGSVREGDPDAPALWQEASDFVNNIWWLNLQSPEAAFAFHQRAEKQEVWRMFHVGKLMEMVALVWLAEEYTKKGDSERPDYWSNHRATLELWEVLTVQSMWSKLEDYVQGGNLEDE